MKSDKIKKELMHKEHDYETFNLEIEELKKSIENTQQQIKASEETVAQLKEKHDEIVSNSKEMNVSSAV